MSKLRARSLTEAAIRSILVIAMAEAGPLLVPGAFAGNAPSERQLVLTGVVTFSTNKWAVLTEPTPDGGHRSWTLREGGRAGTIEMIQVDGAAGSVTVRVDGRTQKLQLLSPGTRPSATESVSDPAERQRLEFIRAHARFHEQQQSMGNSQR